MAYKFTNIRCFYFLYALRKIGYHIVDINE